jgi:hypothetical protein
MRPQDVLSPRNRIRADTLKVLLTSKDKWSWSVAEMEWLDWDDDGREEWNKRIGIRWDGNLADPNDKGHPRSHGSGTWFMLPDPIGKLVKAAILLTGRTTSTAEQAESAEQKAEAA